MRIAAATTLILILSLSLAACLPKEQETVKPTPDLEETVEARLEATREMERMIEATVEAKVAMTQAVRATVEARTAERETPGPEDTTSTATVPSIPNSTRTAPSMPNSAQTPVPNLTGIPTETPALIQIEEPSPTPQVHRSDCDQLLRDQLVFQTGAHTAARMNEVIRQIQAHRENCASHLWNPVAVNADTNHPASCAGPAMETAIELPSGLSSADGKRTRADSGRDPGNNIVVHWSSNPRERPTHGSTCWVYFSEWDLWMTGPELGTTTQAMTRPELEKDDCIFMGETKIEKVPCEGQWTHRVLGILTAEERGAYPGADYFRGIAYHRCGPNHTAHHYPFEEGWLLGKREIVCLQEDFGLSVSDPDRLDRIVRARSLREGDCIKEFIESGGAMSEIVDCNGDWELRVLSSYQLQGQGEYPGTEELEIHGTKLCDRRHHFASYPSPTSWALGNREIICVQSNWFPDIPNPAERNYLLDRAVNPLLLEPGECLISNEAYDYIPIVTGCSSEWDFQVTKKIRIQGYGVFPSFDQLAIETERACGPDLENHFAPDEIWWDLGIRNIVCTTPHSLTAK